MSTFRCQSQSCGSQKQAAHHLKQLLQHHTAKRHHQQLQLQQAVVRPRPKECLQQAWRRADQGQQRQQRGRQVTVAWTLLDRMWSFLELPCRASRPLGTPGALLCRGRGSGGLG